MKRLLFFIAFMTLGTWALIELLVTEPSVTQRAVVEEPPLLNVLNMEDVSVHQLVGERVRWDLFAARAHFNENTRDGLLEEVRFHVYEAQADGSQRQTVFSGRSARATLAGGPGLLVLQGKVLLEQGQTLEIRSERLEFDERAQVLSAPGRVTVRSPQGVQEADSLRYYVAEQRLEYTRPVFYQ